MAAVPQQVVQVRQLAVQQHQLAERQHKAGRPQMAGELAVVLDEVVAVADGAAVVLPMVRLLDLQTEPSTLDDRRESPQASGAFHTLQTWARLTLSLARSKPLLRVLEPVLEAVAVVAVVAAAVAVAVETLAVQ